MTTTTTALDEVLATALAAVAAGDSARARHYFRNLTEIAPDMLEAWLGYAACTTVLAERRALYARALELDPRSVEAAVGLAEAEAGLASGRLLHASARMPEPVIPILHERRSVTEAPRELPALIVVGLSCLVIMGTLTGFGIFVLTSFWGFLLAFVAGPAVSELIVRASVKAGRVARGRRLQLVTALGMILGGVGAMVAGAMLLQLLGLPLPVEAVQIAQRTGVGTDPTSVLLNSPGLLIFLSSAVAATIYRMR